MSALLVVLIVFGLTCFIGVAWFIGLYNKLVKLKHYFENAYAQIDVQLQRRYDLIPNLVETAKGYMEHEKDTLESVIQARNQAHQINVKVASNPSDAGNLEQLAHAENQLTKAMGGFFALAESYPDLKADKTMTQLMEELSSTENKVGFARQAFNDAVMSYNIATEIFPGSIVAGIFNFTQAKQLELETQEARKAVKVSFGH